MSIRASLVASAALVLSTLATLSGCNFILNPDGDGVIRCDNADECEVPLADALADNRGQPSCGNAGGGAGGGGLAQGQDDKVCSIVDKEDVPCNGDNLLEGSPARTAWDTAKAALGVYVECPPELYGKAGCPPNGGSCDAGLKPRTYKTQTGKFDGPDDQPGERTVCTPDGDLAVMPNPSLRGYDVLDQHCRSYFCDEEFVCNSNLRCVRCDPEKPYGRGGCGTMYFYGEKSPVYLDNDTNACHGKNADKDKTAVGSVVEARPTCADGEKNGSETGVDCGGPDCSPCAPTCSDGEKNGSETDVDCGGSCPTKCADSLKCNVAGDCESGVCTDNACQAPACDDTVKNGDEEDVDCGGSCPACP